MEISGGCWSRAIKSVLSVGVLSGTSADGIDVALIEHATTRPRIVAAKTYPYRPATVALVRNFHGLTTEGFARLHRDVAVEFAGAVIRLLGRARVSPRRISVIGSHGQTVYHIPSSMSLQVGAPGLIAARTGIPVAADFRVCDIGAGGQGAPLVPALDRLLLGKRQGRVAALNIGGISNVTVLVGGRVIASYDTGPGNALIDAACRRWFRRPFDRGGNLARRGTVIPELLGRILGHEYFARRPPKSTGVEEFGDEFFSRRMGINRIKSALLRRDPRRAADVVATLTEFTAITIADELRKARVREVWVSGGGCENATLMARLARHLPKVRIARIDEMGLSAAFKEAALFAYLGECRLRQVPLDLRTATGASKPKILGGLWLP